MSRAILRPLAAALLVPMMVHLVGCSVREKTPRSVPASTVRDFDRTMVVGVTTVAGDTVMFDLAKVNPSRREQERPQIRSDTLYARVQGELYRLPVEEVQRYWIRPVSTARTLGVAAAAVGGAVLVLGLFIAATKESCPFVYSWNGSEWVFDGEPYGGATTHGLERDDYAELEHLVAEDGEYRIRVTNEVPETQYTNQLELIVVDHAPGTRVVSDGRGAFHQVRDPLRPLRAEDESGRDLTDWLAGEDRLIWEPGPGPSGNGERSEIVLTFPRPEDADRATLVHRVGTGIWGSYMLKSMLELHGREVDAWYAAIDSDPAARRELHDWNLREELYSLKVQVERSGRWEEAGVISGGGPFVLETRSLPIELEGSEGDRLRLRIRPPRGFWALDAFAVEYGDAHAPLSVRTVAPVRARDQLGRDVLPALASSDDAYYAMPSNDDRAEVAFPAPPAVPGMERTVFLYARGWYRIHLDESRSPDRETLRRIATVPGAAARYAAESFDRFQLALR